MSAVEWAARVINTGVLFLLGVAVGSYTLYLAQILADQVWQRVSAWRQDRAWRRWERRFTTRTGP